MDREARGVQLEFKNIGLIQSGDILLPSLVCGLLLALIRH